MLQMGSLTINIYFPLCWRLELQEQDANQLGFCLQMATCDVSSQSWPKQALPPPPPSFFYKGNSATVKAQPKDRISPPRPHLHRHTLAFRISISVCYLEDYTYPAHVRHPGSCLGTLMSNCLLLSKMRLFCLVEASS